MTMTDRINVLEAAREAVAVCDFPHAPLEQALAAFDFGEEKQ